MGDKYWIGKTSETGDTVSRDAIIMETVLVHKSGGTFNGPVAAVAFSGDGTNITNTPNTIVTGATFVGTTLNIDSSDDSQVSTTLTVISGVTLNVTEETFLIDGKKVGDSTFKHWGEIYNDDNITTTDIITTGVSVKVNATTILGGQRGFSMPSDNKLVYTATTTGQTFEVTATVSGEAATGSQSAQFSIYKNGTNQIMPTISTTEWSATERSLSLTGTMSMEQGDFIELWCQNNSSNKDLEIISLTIRIAQI